VRLELDIGNTYAKWRLMAVDGVVKDRGAVETGKGVVDFFPDAYFFPQVDQLLVSSVSCPKLEVAVCQLFEAGLSSVRIFQAKSKREMGGVEFIYTDIRRLGVDRCLAMVGAYDRFRAGVLVIDCGSAMTADLVSSIGKHLGGYIFPGYRLLKHSLLSGTSNVIVSTDVEPHFRLGENTEECVDNGAHMMMRSTLLGLIELAASYGIHDVLLTGGDGLKAKTLLGDKYEYDEDLVFKGLGVVNPYSLG
jgi:type III pantothenate kinase